MKKQLYAVICHALRDNGIMKTEIELRNFEYAIFTTASNQKNSHLLMQNFQILRHLASI